jgi:hypothetical protein
VSGGHSSEGDWGQSGEGLDGESTRGGDVFVLVDRRFARSWSR